MSRAFVSKAVQPVIRGEVFWVLSILSLVVLMLLIATLPGMMKSEQPLISETNLLFYTLVLYFAGAALYLAYTVWQDEIFFQVASKLVWPGFLLHNGAVALRWIVAGRPPVSNIYEMTISFAWGIIFMHLIMEHGYKFKFSGLFALPMASLAIILTMILPGEVRPLMPALQSNLLYIHVSAALFSYAACALSFVTAVLFLFKDKLKLVNFGIVISSIVTSTYLLLDQFSVVTRGVYHVVAWNSELMQTMHVAPKTPLTLEVPDMGPLLLTTFLVSVVSLVLYVLAHLKQSSLYESWASRILVASTALQALALMVLTYQIQNGAFEHPLYQSLFRSSLSANPFEIVGLVSALVLSLIYLAIEKWQDSIRSFLPRKEVLDDLTYKMITIAFPLLTLMLITGSIWANRAWGSYWNWDPKEDWALITWLVYATYLHVRITRGWSGRKSAYFSIVGFAVVMFTFLGVTYLLPGMHAYAN
jgi:cytochrome c-type biogenesis protein CcsB